MHLLRFYEPAFPLASLTKWVCIHVPVADAFPCPSIPALGCRVPVILFVPLVLFSLMFLTEPAIRQLRTAGVGTRPLWFPWHRLTSSRHKESPRRKISHEGFWLYTFSLILSYSTTLCATREAVCQSVPMSDKIRKVLESRPMYAVDCPQRNIQQLCYFLPCPPINIPVAQQQLFLIILNTVNGLTHRFLQIHIFIHHMADVPLQFINLADTSGKRSIRRTVRIMLFLKMAAGYPP